MMNHPNQIITVTVDQDGYIVNNTAKEYFLFHNRKNIFEIEHLEQYKHILRADFHDKKLLVNLFKLNYSVFKLPLQLNCIQLTQYVFEEWRLNNLRSLNKKIVVNGLFCDINNYTPTEREVIYCLLNGFVQDKEILGFLNQSNMVKRSNRNISYAITELHSKFETNNRSALIQSIRAHDLDMYLPRTLFTPGVYDNLR